MANHFQKNVQCLPTHLNSSMVWVTDSRPGAKPRARKFCSPEWPKCHFGHFFEQKKLPKCKFSAQSTGRNNLTFFWGGSRVPPWVHRLMDQDRGNCGAEITKLISPVRGDGLGPLPSRGVVGMDGRGGPIVGEPAGGGGQQGGQVPQQPVQPPGEGQPAEGQPGEGEAAVQCTVPPPKRGRGRPPPPTPGGGN